MKKTILLIASWGFFSLAGRAQGDKEDVRIAMALLNKQKKRDHFPKHSAR